VAASRTVTQPRSPVEQVGLLGAPDPAATLAEARAAFSAGDVVGASGLASDALDRLRDAGRDGLVRLVSAAVVLLAALGGLVWLVRRRRQRPIPGYTAGP
jgi:transcription initiation factor TFIID subunit TAF12